MDLKNIRFEQASFIMNEADKIEIYERRISGIIRLFSKSPYMQFKAWDLYEKILELSDAYFEKDYSKYLLKKSDEAFEQFEELQNNEDFISSRDEMIKMIKTFNDLNIL